MAEVVRRRMRERRAREEELVINSDSSLEEEEDPVSLSSSSSEEEEGTTIPSQSDPVDDLELPPPPQIHRPVTCSTLGRPTSRPKHKASKKKAGEPNISTRKRPKA